MGHFYDWEGPLGHKRPTDMVSIFWGPSRCTVTPNAEEGVLALEGHLPGGRALGALCAEKPFLTSAVMELRVPQVRRLPVCISRVDTTHKCLSLYEALGRQRPPDLRTCLLRFSRALLFCPQHWLLCHLGLY